MDGTLTQPVHDFCHIRRELDIPQNADILGFIAKQPPEKRKKLTEELDQFELFYAEQAKPADGVQDLLNLLSNLGVRLAVLTRNTREVAFSSLAHIGVLDLFEPHMILGRNEARPKPDPDGVNRILSYWQRRPHQAVMVGDYVHDLNVGRAAGTATIHVAVNPEHHWPEQTDLRVESLKCLYQLIVTDKA